MKYAVCALIFRGDKILSVSRKNDHKIFGLIGGKVDYGETLIEALFRETKEETGLDIFSLKAQCLCQDPIVETYVSFDHELYETKCWLYKIDEEVELVHPIGNEIDERRWVSTEEACIMLSQTKCEMLQTALYYIKHFPYFSI